MKEEGKGVRLENGQEKLRASAVKHSLLSAMSKGKLKKLKGRPQRRSRGEIKGGGDNLYSAKKRSSAYAYVYTFATRNTRSPTQKPHSVKIFRCRINKSWTLMACRSTSSTSLHFASVMATILKLHDWRESSTIKLLVQQYSIPAMRLVVCRSGMTT